MRVVFGAVGAFAILVLGALQVTAAVALRAQAAPASLAYHAPSAVIDALDSLDPHIYEPEELRRVLGAAALARGDIARAARFAQSLHAGPDRSALEGAIAQRRGDDSGAIADYLAAGDLVRLEALIDATAARGDDARALQLQAVTIAALEKSGAQNDTIAEAYYRQGLLLQASAYKTGVASPAGHAFEVRSQAAYARASSLAPLEARYLIALGNQDLNVGQLADAVLVFTRLQEHDPTSLEALTGLADWGIRAHDLGSAKRYLDAAERLAPQSPDVARLRARLHP